MGSDPKQRGSDVAFWGSHFTRGPTVCRHPTQPTHPTRRSEKREAPFLVRRRVGCVGWVVQISLVGAAARTFAVITDLGDRRGLRRELSVTIEDTILRRAHGARRTPPASPYVGGGAQLARLRAELLRSCCGGIAAARGNPSFHHRHPADAHCGSRVRRAEPKLSLCCDRLAKRQRTRALRSQSDRTHRGGEAAAVEDIISCAQGAQLVLYLVYSRMAVRRL